MQILPRRRLARHRLSAASRWPAEQIGQGLVEFALLLPVLLLILLGAVDLGRAFDAYVTITNASREGARYGSTHARNSPTLRDTIKGKAIQEASLSGITISLTDVSVECMVTGSTSFSDTNCDNVGNVIQIRVTVTNRFQFLTLFLFNLPDIGMSNYTIMPIFSS